MNNQAQVFRQGLAELDERCCWLRSKTGLLWKAAATVLALYLIALTASWMLGDLGTISSIDIPAELGQLVKDVTDSSSTINDSGSGVTNAAQILVSLTGYLPTIVFSIAGFMIVCTIIFSEDLGAALKIAVVSVLVWGVLTFAPKILGIDDPSSSATSSYATFTSAVEDGRARDVEHQLKSIAQSGKSVDSLQVDYLLAQMIVRYHSHPEVREGSFEKTREWYRFNGDIARRFADKLGARQGQVSFEIDPDHLYAIEHFVYGKLHSQAAVGHERNHNRLLEALNTVQRLLIGLLSGLIVLSTGIVLLRAILTRRAGRIRSLLGGSLESEKIA